MLKKGLTLAPAVEPEPVYCSPTLSHSDLHVGNIFVNNTDLSADDFMHVTGIIDWQGIAVRPLFETKPAEFVTVDEENLQYSRLSPPDNSRCFQKTSRSSAMPRNTLHLGRRPNSL